MTCNYLEKRQSIKTKNTDEDLLKEHGMANQVTCTNVCGFGYAC